MKIAVKDRRRQSDASLFTSEVASSHFFLMMFESLSQYPKKAIFLVLQIPITYRFLK